MEEILSTDTKIAIYLTNCMMKINDIIDTNYQGNQFGFAEKYLRGDNPYKQHLVDQCLAIIDEYKPKIQALKIELKNELESQEPDFFKRWSGINKATK